MSGAAGTNRDLQFWSRGKNQRWALRATDATESGTGDGSDFALVRYDDSQASVTGDSVNRLAIDINGTQSFGPGGSGARDTSWGRLGAGQIGRADSDLVAGLAGKGLKVKEGSNAKMGTLTLNGATA
jgi:hypothetical protein